ncbi:hypothetical protein R1T08_17215 [Streptomyces sp. SBC-4]|nr:hypothetical protein [Streptomyces sp. SBC-4]MDV5145901.1 hypothetical protein [Streptomyces sp. SBC-4]
MTARTMAVRLARAQRRAERRDTLLGLLARLDTLTGAEQALLVEYVHAELAASDDLRRTVQGQQRALQVSEDRTRAADATIVEVEQERDAARQELAAVRQYDRALIEASSWPTLPYGARREPLTVHSGSYCAACRTWSWRPPDERHVCPNPPAAEQRPTTTKEN